MIRSCHSPAFILWSLLFFFVFVINTANAQTRYWHYYNENLKEDAYFFESYERPDVLLLKIAERYSGNQKKYGSLYRTVSAALLTGYRTGDSNFFMRGVELVDTLSNHAMHTIIILGATLPRLDEVLAADTNRIVTIAGFGSSEIYLNMRGYNEEFKLNESRKEYYCMEIDYEIQPREFYSAGLNRFGSVNMWSDNAAKTFGDTIITCLRSRNKELLAEHCLYPLIIYGNFPHPYKEKKLRIQTKKEFIRKYDSIFTPEFINLVEQTYTRSQSYFIDPAPGRPDRFMEIFSSSQQLMSVQCAEGKLKIYRIFNRSNEGFPK